MSVRTIRGLLDVQRGKSEREVEGEAKDTDVLQRLSCCPACNQESNPLLILPCSHAMCAQCIAAAAGMKLLPVCSVLCTGCRHPVELPCRSWSSATSCLPKHPACISRETGSTGTSQAHLPHVQQADDMTAQRCLHRSCTAESSPLPVGGTVDLREEEMERSVFGLCFALDPSSVPPSLRLSNSSLAITYQAECPPAPSPNMRGGTPVTSDPRVSLALPQICANVVIARGQYYWEVDVCNSSVYRIGVSSLDGCSGWWFQRQGSSFSAVYDGSQEMLYTVPPQIKTLGVFLNMGGGALSFHNPLTQEHLATLPTCFPASGVLPALGLGQGRIRLRCGLPPPPHVFLSKDSAYRGPRHTGGGSWRKDTSFKSVRKVIQKFEELAVSDSDSGLVSSFGSSSSTVASLSDLGISGTFPSGQGGRETEAE